MLRKPLRRILRLILFGLARWALKKHQPTVIAIVGEGKTAIAREAIYAALKNRFPVRRNLEFPDAEFVLPLTVLGAKEYPTSSPGWLSLLLRSTFLLLRRPKHSHLLILELGGPRQEVFDYFWETTRPKILVTVGPTPYLRPNHRARKAFKVRETPDLSGYRQAAIKVAKSLGVPERESRAALTHLTLPRARIRILPAKAGGLVVDAGYQYFPPKEEALDEILAALPGRKILVTPETREIPKEVKDGEVAVLLGPARKMWPALLQLAKEPWT